MTKIQNLTPNTRYLTPDTLHPAPYTLSPVDKIIFCAVDTETTGLYPHLGDRICDLGAVKFTLSSDLQEFSTFINPGIRLSRTIRYITGITDRMLKDAPSINEIRDEFLSFIGESVLLFHNAPFDLSFLQYEFETEIENLVVDTLILARRKFDFGSNRLGDIAKLFKIKEEPHRALNDAKTVSKIAKEMIKRLAPKTLGDLLLEQRGSMRVGSKRIKEKG